MASPPAKVDVAAVPVAGKDKPYGVVDAITFPELLTASKVDALMFERFNVVPASNVKVPEVYESEASARRNREYREWLRLLRLKSDRFQMASGNSQRRARSRY